jgi:phosphatidylserine/phosphatidylglycerophosphate/cardiolipin synthase-like enzyme
MGRTAGVSLTLALLVAGIAFFLVRSDVPDPIEIADTLGLIDQLGLAPPEVGAASATLSTPPARAGNTVRLLTNGEAAFAERTRLLGEAKDSIYIQVLIFKADTTGRALADALLERKRRDPGLDIRVIVDAYANLQDVRAQLMYAELKGAGIEVEGFEAFYLHWLNEVNLTDWMAGNMRYHEKYWIVDGEQAVVGGMNIGDEYARCSSDPVMIWRDQDVYLQGPVVKDLWRAFRDNFDQFKATKKSKPAFADTDAYWETWRTFVPGGEALLRAAVSTGRVVEGSLARRGDPSPCDGQPVVSRTWEDVDVRFVRSRPRAGETHIEELYVSLIEAASSSVLIENAYFVPSPQLRTALAAAARRGVRVQVVNNSTETNDLPIITTAGRLYYRELVEAGVEVYEWHGERFGEGTLHAKLAVFDDRLALIGSYNLDPRSRGLNSEDVVVIAHPGLAAELGAWCADHDLPMAERVTLQQAVGWAEPGSLPAAPDDGFRLSDARMDPARLEYFLLRQIESSL